jgi:competence protein ComEA
MGWKEHIYFTKQERNGIMVFMSASIFVWFVSKNWPVSNTHENIPDIKAFYKNVDSSEYYGIDGSDDYGIDRDLSGSYSNENRNRKDRHKFTRGERFQFDPNTVSEDSLLRLGFSSFATTNLLNYRSKGGKIRNIDKLKSIFGMDTSFIEYLKPFINFPEFESEFPNARPNRSSHISVVSLQFAELNTADSNTLVNIRGIGPYKASKILAYRQRLGGFLSTEQLLEIPQIGDPLFNEIQHLLEADPEKIKRININTADYTTLIRHPYLDKKSVNLILNYRKQHGPFGRAEEIKRIRAFTEDFVKKILPYLSTESMDDL